MSSIIPDSNAFNWIIVPATDCVLRIGSEIQRLNLVRHAISALPFHEKLLEHSFFIEKSLGKNTDDLVKLIIPLRDGLSQQASDLLEDDFGPINRQMLIGLWSAVEVAIEDTVLLVLNKDANAVDLVRSLGVKKLPVDKSRPLSESEASVVYQNLERWFRNKNKDTQSAVAQSYCDLLMLLGIPLKLSAHLSEQLSELNAIRHCLLHRSGVVDEDAVTDVPRLNLQLGDHIKISSEQYQGYFQSVADFSTAMLEAVLQSRYVRFKNENSDID